MTSHAERLFDILYNHISAGGRYIGRFTGAAIFYTAENDWTAQHLLL